MASERSGLLLLLAAGAIGPTVAAPAPIAAPTAPVQWIMGGSGDPASCAGGECGSENGNNNCDQVCASVGETCEPEAIDSLTNTGAIHAAFAAAGFTCSSDKNDMGCQTRYGGGHCASWGSPYLYNQGNYLKEGRCFFGDGVEHKHASCGQNHADGNHRRLCPCTTKTKYTSIACGSKCHLIQWPYTMHASYPADTAYAQCAKDCGARDCKAFSLQYDYDGKNGDKMCFLYKESAEPSPSICANDPFNTVGCSYGTKDGSFHIAAESASKYSVHDALSCDRGVEFISGASYSQSVLCDRGGCDKSWDAIEKECLSKNEGHGVFYQRHDPLGHVICGVYNEAPPTTAASQRRLPIAAVCLPRAAAAETTAATTVATAPIPAKLVFTPEPPKPLLCADKMAIFCLKRLAEPGTKKFAKQCARKRFQTKCEQSCNLCA